MTLSEFYAAIGGDVSAVLMRIPSKQMLARFVRMYASDPTFRQLQAAVNAQNWPAAFLAAHTLKGVAQNLGFPHLQTAASALTEHLRGDRPLTDRALLEDVVRAHSELTEALSRLSA